jgi:hypothetical protein
LAIGKSLGLTIESDAKTKYLRPRIEATLRGGDLVLVLDEAANLWPCHFYSKVSRPARIAWIMQMTNQGASIALLMTQNFFASQADFLEKSRWQSSQFYGRVGKFVKLPDTLPLADLENVARAWLPDGDRRSIEALADLANLSPNFLSVIEHTVRQATHYARQDGRDRAGASDIRRAITTDIMPGAENLAVSIRWAAIRRKAPATEPR